MPRKSPIENEREKDIRLLRDVQLEIINDPEVSKKDKIEASKLLARLHHALQVDRTIAKAEVKTKSPVNKKLQDDINDRLNDILRLNQGPGTH